MYTTKRSEMHFGTGKVGWKITFLQALAIGTAITLKLSKKFRKTHEKCLV